MGLMMKTDTRARILAAMAEGQEWSSLMMSRHLEHDRNSCADMLAKLSDKGIVHVSDRRPSGKSNAMTNFYRIGPAPTPVRDMIVTNAKPMEPFEWLCSTLLSVATSAR